MTDSAIERRQHTLSQLSGQVIRLRNEATDQAEHDQANIALERLDWAHTLTEKQGVLDGTRHLQEIDALITEVKLYVGAAGKKAS